MKHDITQPDTTCVRDRCLTRVQLKNECRIQPAIAYNIFSHLKVSWHQVTSTKSKYRHSTWQISATLQGIGNVVPGTYPHLMQKSNNFINWFTQIMLALVPELWYSNLHVWSCLMFFWPICPNFMISDLVFMRVFHHVVSPWKSTCFDAEKPWWTLHHLRPKLRRKHRAKAHVPHPWQLWHRRLELCQGPTGPDGSEVLRVFAPGNFWPFMAGPGNLKHMASEICQTWANPPPGFLHEILAWPIPTCIPTKVMSQS